MPETRPLSPIIHWRRRTPAMVINMVLKSQLLRQLHWLAAVGEGKGDLTRGQRADASDSGPGW